MRGLSLVAARRGYSLVVVHGLLVVAASLVPEHRFQAQGLQQLWDAVLIPVASSLPDQGLDACPLHWQVDFYPCFTREVPPFSFK